MDSTQKGCLPTGEQVQFVIDGASTFAQATGYALWYVISGLITVIGSGVSGALEARKESK